MVNCPVILSGWIGLPDTEKESNTLDASVFSNSDLCCLAIYFHLCSTLRNFQVQKLLDMCVIHVGGEVTCRKLVVHFMLHYCSKTFLRKGFDPELYESKFT